MLRNIFANSFAFLLRDAINNSKQVKGILITSRFLRSNYSGSLRLRKTCHNETIAVRMSQTAE